MRRILSRAGAVALLVALVLAAPAIARVIKGTPDDDKLVGSKNGDKIVGKAGDDILRSSEGGDFLLAGKGDDFIKAGQGFDEIRAGKGDDEIHVRDGRPDQIECGPGKDKVLADEVEEGMFDCEKVKVLNP